MRRALSAAVLLALLLVCFARLVARPSALLVDGTRPSVDRARRAEARAVGNDLTFTYLPQYLSISARIAHAGRLPLWDARGFAGRPLVGNPQAGLFYPPLWLAFRSGSPAAFGWLTVAHLFWGGIGAYVLIRSRGASLGAGVVGAACFEASPYLLAQAFEGHYPHVWAASWYTWAFLAFGAFRRGDARRAWPLAPILALAFLAGHPQEWLYLVCALGLWSLVDLVRATRAGQGRAATRALALGVALLGLSLGLIAIELLPDLAAQRRSLRSDRPGLGKSSHYQLEPWNLLQLLDPGALGGPADYFGPDNYWEAVFSIGLVPLILAALAVWRHPDRRLVRGWLILCLAAAWFAAGRKFGLFTLLCELVPGVNRFRVPSRSLFLGALGGSVLAGLGVDALARLAGSPTDWKTLERMLRRGAVGVLVALVVGQGIGWVRGSAGAARLPSGPRAWPTTKAEYRALRQELRARQPDRALLASGRLLRSGPFWVSAVGLLAVFALARHAPARRRTLPGLVGLLALIELGWHGQALMRVEPAGTFLDRDPIGAALADATPPVRGPYRVRARDVLYDDLRAAAHGVEKVNVNDYFQIQRSADLYETLYRFLDEPPLPRAEAPMDAVVADQRRLLRQGVLDRLNVAFLIADARPIDLGWPLSASGTSRGAPFRIYRNPTALPRAYVVPRAEVAPDGLATALALFRTLDPRGAVVMAADPLAALNGTRQPFTPAEWHGDDPDRIELRVATAAPGLLVVADTWMPGWSATLDGRSVPVLRGNHAQRVIALPDAGRHEVILRYHAPGLATGAAVTTLAATLWAVAWLALAVPRRGRPHRAYPDPHFLGRSKRIYPQMTQINADEI